MHDALIEFPRSLSAYPPMIGQPLWEVLRARVEAEPFNAFATAIFLLAVVHTFVASWFTGAAHRVQHSHDAELARRGQPSHPSPLAEALHFLGEIEVVFGLWSLALLVAIISAHGWDTAVHYVNSTVNYTEPLFVIVIMALASTRPIVNLAESALRQLARTGGASPAAWWMVILIVGPLLGSFVTEPAAMTISALLLARQFFDLSPAPALRYATLGLLFVNVSIGGTLTHFAAPPVLIVAREWQWDTLFMLNHFGWRAVLAIVAATLLYYVWFRKELAALRPKPAVPDVEIAADDASADQRLLPVPAWVTIAHIGFMVWTVANSHYPALFIGGFLFFLGFARATAAFQSQLDMKTPMLVGFFLAGIVIHGGVQGWWIAPVLSSLSQTGLFWAATVLTAFNDNALITKLATLVPDFADTFKVAVVEGAVTGGGLTVIANAPNPAGQALLGRFFGGSVNPLKLMAAALIPTLIAAAAFRLL
jgi:Putative Na+/H+ antiporter